MWQISNSFEVNESKQTGIACFLSKENENHKRSETSPTLTIIKAPPKAFPWQQSCAVNRDLFLNAQNLLLADEDKKPATQ